MAFRGVTFSKQSVSSNDDAHVFKTLLGGRKGKTKGCGMTYDVDNIFVSEGRFFAPDRMIEITSLETIATPVVTETTYFRLVFEVDLTKANTSSDFAQGYFKILSSATSYPDIVQENLDDGGNIYQLPFARFTKTVAGIGTFVSELEIIAIPPAEDTTIFVSKSSGNDISGDGTESAPYATIQHAIDSISKNINNKIITINIASGTYAEDIEIAGFYGGTLRFSFGTVTINSFSLYESCVILSGSGLTIAANGKTYGFYCHRGANVICQLPITINGSVNGLYVGYGSRFAGRNTITINSCTYAVTSTFAAYVYIITLEGSRNNNGVQAAAGIVSIGSIAAEMASTLYITSAGGRIFAGSQSNVPTY